MDVTSSTCYSSIPVLLCTKTTLFWNVKMSSLVVTNVSEKPTGSNIWVEEMRHMETWYGYREDRTGAGL
jgi:hypothetical protein